MFLCHGYPQLLKFTVTVRQFCTHRLFLCIEQTSLCQSFQCIEFFEPPCGHHKKVALEQFHTPLHWLRFDGLLKPRHVLGMT